MKEFGWIIIGMLTALIAFHLLGFTKQSDPEVIYMPTTGQVENIETIDTGSQSTGTVVLEGQEVEETCILTGASITAKFTQWFIDNYEYEHNKNYSFALRVNGLYYEVSRNERGGVDNRKGELEGAVPANKLVDGHTRYIPFGAEVNVAQPNGIMGYRKTVFTGIQTYELSSVKEGVPTSDLVLENEYDCF